jgi:hypothetical protein
MDNILKHLGAILKEHTSDVVQEPLPGLIMLNLLHLRRSEQE